MTSEATKTGVSNVSRCIADGVVMLRPGLLRLRSRVLTIRPSVLRLRRRVLPLRPGVLRLRPRVLTIRPGLLRLRSLVVSVRPASRMHSTPSAYVTTRRAPLTIARSCAYDSRVVCKAHRVLTLRPGLLRLRSLDAVRTTHESYAKHTECFRYDPACFGYDRLILCVRLTSRMHGTRVLTLRPGLLRLRSATVNERRRVVCMTRRVVTLRPGQL
jgi:hypothetical protein